MRALRICSAKYLDDEFGYIEDTFSSLSYPRQLILGAKHKALKIHRVRPSVHNNIPTTTTTSKVERGTLSAAPDNPIGRIFLPNNPLTEHISNNLNVLKIKTTTLPTKSIRNILNNTSRLHITSNACVYQVPCRDCNLSYVGETGRSLKSRISEHKRDIRLGNLSSALVIHIAKSDHNFDFDSVKILKYIHNKNLRQIYEAGMIATSHTVNNRPGFFQIASCVARLMRDNRTDKL